MKLRCEVIGVETTGDGLRLTLQGKPNGAAEWRNLERQEFVIPATQHAKRAFYVGRMVAISMRPC